MTKPFCYVGQLTSVAEGDITYIYTYDAAGSVIGMQYRAASYAEDEWEDINKGYWYLGVSSFFGPLGYFFIFGEC